MRTATVAPRVAPWRARPSAVGRTPQEQSGSGVPMADAHRTERILPRPRNRFSRDAGTRMAKTPARTNPSSRRKEASIRIDQASAATWSRNSVMRATAGERRAPAALPRRRSRHRQRPRPDTPSPAHTHPPPPNHGTPPPPPPPSRVVARGGGLGAGQQKVTPPQPDNTTAELNSHS